MQNIWNSIFNPPGSCHQKHWMADSWGCPGWSHWKAATWMDPEKLCRLTGGAVKLEVSGTLKSLIYFVTQVWRAFPPMALLCGVQNIVILPEQSLWLNGWHWLLHETWVLKPKTASYKLSTFFLVKHRRPSVHHHCGWAVKKAWSEHG